MLLCIFPRTRFINGDIYMKGRGQRTMPTPLSPALSLKPCPLSRNPCPPKSTLSPTHYLETPPLFTLNPSSLPLRNQDFGGCVERTHPCHFSSPRKPAAHWLVIWQGAAGDMWSSATEEQSCSFGTGQHTDTDAGSASLHPSPRGHSLSK